MLCLKLALVALVFGQLASGYDTDKLYRYRFEGSLSTHIDSDSKYQAAGLTIASNITLKQASNDELIVQLRDPQWAVTNSLSDSSSLSPKPMDLSGSLSKAFKIYLEPAGSVKSFDIIKDEPIWVTNFKRGLLSLFNLKIKQQQQQQQDSSSPISESFTTPEKSVFGECDTDYVVNANENSLNVTKWRNMAKCKSRWSYRYTPIDSSECYDCEKQDQHQFRRSNAVFKYNLLGSRSNHAIESASLDESYISSPFGQNSYTTKVSSKYQLRLLSIENGSSGDLTSDSNSQATDSLAYEPAEVMNFYANVNLEQEHHVANLFQINPTVDDVIALMSEFADEHKRYTSAGEIANDLPETSSNYQENSTIGPLFIRLTELAGSMNLKQLGKLYEKVDEKGENFKRIFWDVMSATGTNPSFIYMRNLITEGDAPQIKIKAYLTRISFHLKSPSKALLDEYVNLCKADKLQSKEFKKLCLLPLASLINQHCVKPHARFMRIQAEGGNATAYKRSQANCQLATADEYYSKMVQTFAPSASAQSSVAQSSDDQSLSIGDKMFNIKLAGELGVKPSIEFLEKIIRAKGEHPVVRSAAMWNLMNAATIYPNIVKRISLPFYEDTSELLELRIAAFYNWFRAGPTLNDLETIAKNLQHEPNRQLVLYIHSLMKSLGQLDWWPCGQGTEKYAKLLMPTIRKALAKHAPGSLGDSHVSISSSYLQQYGYGSLKLYSAIYGDEGFAPSNIYFTNGEVMAGGIKTTPMTVSIQAHGLDKLIKRVIGINGLLADKESFMDVFSKTKRSKREVASPELIKQETSEIDRELKLATREFSDVYLSIIVSYYGRPIMMLERDSRELKKMLSDDGTIRIPHVKKLIHSFNNHTSLSMMLGVERLEVFNNELGFPIYSSMSEFQQKNFKLNTIKFDVEPGFFNDERQGKPPSKIAISVDAKSNRHSEFMGHSGVLLTSLKQQVGAGFQKKRILNLPIKMGLEVNLAESKLTVKRQPIYQNLAYIKHTPGTMVRSYAPSELNKVDWRDLYDSSKQSQMKPFQLEYMTPLAIGLRGEGKHKQGFDLSMSTITRHLNHVGFGAAQFLLNFAPSGSPLELRLGTKTTESNPTKELSTIISWRHYRPGNGPNSLQLSSEEKELEDFILSKSADSGSTDQQDYNKKPTTVRYDLTLLGGSTKERKVSLSFAHSRSFDHLLHKWRLAYQRTPLEQQESSSSSGDSATNLCLIGQAKFPKYDIKRWLAFDLLQMDHSANITKEISFSSDSCTLSSASEAQSKNEPRVSIDATFNWSREQRDLYETILNPSASRNSIEEDNLGSSKHLAALYDNCQRQRNSNKVQLEPNCLQFLLKTTELQHIKANIDYFQVPTRWTRIMSKLGALYTVARAGYIDEIDDKGHGGNYATSASSCDASGKLSSPSKAQFEANMTSLHGSERRLSYEIDGPGIHVLYKNIPFTMSPLSTFPLAGASYFQMIQRQAGHRFCTVGSQAVTTFDNFTYSMPQINDGCFKLITKDCSPEQNFIVLGAAVGSGKVIKVYVANKFKVEFLPDKEGKSVGDIKLNGQSVQLAGIESKPVRQMTKMGPNNLEAFSIEYNGAYYTLQSKLYRFAVSTDGTWIFVQQSKYYAGKSCGICGDANGDQLQEFKSPSSPMKTCKNSSDFVWSHVLPSTCASRPTNIEC